MSGLRRLKEANKRPLVTLSTLCKIRRMIVSRGLNFNLYCSLSSTLFNSEKVFAIFWLEKHRRKDRRFFEDSGAAVERLSSEEEDPGSMGFWNRGIPTRRVTPERIRVVLKSSFESSFESRFFVAIPRWPVLDEQLWQLKWSQLRVECLLFLSIQTWRWRWRFDWLRTSLPQ